MVLEALVVQLLNKCLGDYVELDGSELQLGIWGGNAVLRKLEIKENALSQLDIPFKVIAGQIGHLELKIPWSQLYYQSVEVILSGVSLLLVPTARIKYDAEKEEKQLQEARQRELQAMEENKRKAAELKNPEIKDDTYIEKMITQIIKNLHVRISNIHVRYEDDITNPQCPLSFGVTLKDLSFHTVDEKGEPCILDENAKLFLKFVQLENLFVYWNVKSKIYSNYSPDQVLQYLEADMEINNLYLFRLMTVDAKLRMNPRSDVDFSSPKVDLEVTLPAVGIELNRPQYISILELVDSVSMMTLNLPYRKYRPEVHVNTNAPIWWRYIIMGILEVDVKPRLHKWSWQRIRKHRETVKRYRELYKEKINGNDPMLLDETERMLDIFNITLARQHAEMELSNVHRLEEEKMGKESKGWFGWMFKKTGEPDSQDKDVTTDAFAAEKAKFYTAIGYSEVAGNKNLPKDFEEMKVDFHMEMLSVSFKDDTTDQNEIIKLTLGELKSIFTQRPGAQAIKLIAKLNMFEVKGLGGDRATPTLVSSRKAATGKGTPLLSIAFETNPLDETADQKLYVESQSLEIIYDAVTVNSMLEFFRPPDNQQLDQLTNVALEKLEKFRDRTASGLMYVIETQTVLDLQVNLLASYVIIPQTGFYESAQKIMVLDLGDLKVSSQSKKGLPQLSVGSSTIEDFRDRAYDDFDIQLNGLQFLYSKSDGDWKKARKQKQSALHILEPVDLEVFFRKAMVDTDSRMPKFKISGKIPLLSLRMFDKKIRGILELIDSIPLPKSKPAPQSTASHTLINTDDTEKHPQKNMTNCLINFEITKVSVELCSLSASQEVIILQVYMEGLNTDLKLCTFDMSLSISIHNICLKCPEYKDFEEKEVHLITTLDNTKDDAFLTLKYITADRYGPEFKSQHENTEQLIKVNLSSLDMHLYIEALFNVMNFFNNLIPPSQTKERGQEDSTGDKKEEPVIAKRQTSEISKFEDVVNQHIKADFNNLKVFIPGEKARISEISIEGLVSDVLMMKKKTEVQAKFKNIAILDCDKDAVYKKVVSTDKEEIAIHMVNYTDATEGESYLDMSKVDTSIALTVGCIRVMYLKRFVSSIMAFIINLQHVQSAEKDSTGVQPAEKDSTGVQPAEKAATEVQSAEKAAMDVVELVERSARIALNVHINMPFFFLPHNPQSTDCGRNVIVVHLGLISVKNQFVKITSETHANIPPVVDMMTVGLSDLRLYRTTFEADQFQGETQLFSCSNMDLSISRNLSSAWYHEIPDMEIAAHIKPMTLMQRQADVKVLLCTLLSMSEGEVAEVVPPTSPPSEGEVAEVVPPPSPPSHSKVTNTVKLDVKFDSITLVLYSPEQKLAEFTLGTITTSLLQYSDSSMKTLVKLTNCLLDDKNPCIQTINPRMMAIDELNLMMEVTNCEGDNITIIDIGILDFYLCVNMKFLHNVANIFLKGSQEAYAGHVRDPGPAQAPDPAPVPAPAAVPAAVPASTFKYNILLRNPEIVFVADLTRADAPALMMRVMQCELAMKNDAEGSLTTAIIKDLKVVACPLLRSNRINNITTVLQPCQVSFKSTQMPTSPEVIEVCISALSMTVSPKIINTVNAIIQSVPEAATAAPQEPDSSVPPELWERQSWKGLKLWFLEDELDEDAQSLAPLIPQGESLQVAINSICLTVEAGVGYGIVPMFLAKSSFRADVKNWKTLINFHGQLSLEMHYYNEMMEVWEPFLEPVEEPLKDDRPWTLDLKMKKEYTGQSYEVDSNIPKCKTVISISSKDHLNITLSKCGLGTLSNLQIKFAEAAEQTTECFQKHPFMVKNCLGLPLSVLYSDMFSPTDGQSDNRTVELQDGESLNMDYSSTATDSDEFSTIISPSENNHYIKSTPLGHMSSGVIPLVKMGQGMYSVVHIDSGVTRFLVCQVYSVKGNKYIKIRSPIQIINHFSIPFKVFEGSTCLGMSLPNEEFCVPLDCYRLELSLQPVMEVRESGQAIEFKRSEGFNYKDVIRKEPGTRLQQTCHCCGEMTGMLIVNIVPLKDTVTTSKHTGSIWDEYEEPYILHLWPSILLRNLLPYTITYKLQDRRDTASEATLEPGHSAQLQTAVIDQSIITLRLLKYLAQNWSAEYRLLSGQEEITFTVFKEEDDKRGQSDCTERERAELNIAMHVKYDPKQTIVAIYSPYWMENKTSQLLQYKAGDTICKHPLDYDTPLLFSFKPRMFLKNKKVCVMISDSEFSKEFFPDTVGSYGDIKCQGKYKDYHLGVKIDTSSFSLTCIVTIMPFYLLVNRTKHTICISEQGQENWTQVQPKQSAIPFWPERDTRYLNIKVEGCESPPQTIDFTRPENCLLLRLDKPLGGITVDVNLSEHSTVIQFSDYYDGAAPFLIINHTKDQVLQFYQSSLEEKEELEPGKAVYYTWTEPTGSRKLHWICGKYKDNLRSEGDLRVDMNKEGKLFVISFYEGLQRVVLFTGELQIYKLLCKTETAQSVTAIIMSLRDVSLSLVNNTTSQEVCFIGVTSSDVVWEFKTKKNSRWKSLSGKMARLLEKSFREYIKREPIDKTIVTLGKKYQVSLTPDGRDMIVLKPFKAQLKRNFRPGVNVQYSISPQQSSYRITINRVQIQNQLPVAIFPYVFYPIKLPKSITKDSTPKPLADIFIVTRAAGHSNISRIKYFKVLIQEMCLKLDLGFLSAIVDLFTPENASITTSEQEEVELFDKDLQYTLAELDHISATDTSPVGLYEYFHISEIKLHLSFTLSAAGEDGQKDERDTELIPIESLKLLLKSIGATLTDIQDVVFTLKFFEMTFQFCTTQQLQIEVRNHYVKQAIKQTYVLVFGLDVLGNPYGLMRVMKEGVEAFIHESYQGATQGAEEFFEGLAYGAKALFSGAVEGIFGAGSRIAGVAAKGLAVITMDDEYQQERLEMMKDQQTSRAEKISRTGNALMSSVVGGVTGVFTKPIEGARKGGVTGFCKGCVKGLVGLVAKPTGGVVDVFRSTFQGITKVAGTSQDLESLRPPRFIHEHGVIQPYKEAEIIGRQILRVIENGRFADYIYHAHAKINDSNFLIITKSSILFVTKRSYGQMTCMWQYLFNEFTKEPHLIEGQCVRIEAAERVKNHTDVIRREEEGFGKIIHFQTPEIAQWFLAKLEEARKQEPDS